MPESIFMVIGAVLVKIIDYLMLRLKLRRQAKDHFPNELSRMSSIYQAMKRVIAETNAQRFLILRVTNGGGRPQFDNPLYISIIYEDYEAPIKPIMNEYKRLQADSSYIELLLQLEKEKTVRFDTNTLKPGLLRTAYESEGLKYGEFYYLSHSAKALYYLSISTMKESRYQDPTQRNLINLTVSRIKQLFSGR